MLRAKEIRSATLLFNPTNFAGYTGDVGRKQVAGFVHGQEYVMTADDTKKYGLVGKTGGEFGEAISDYFPTQTPTSINPYDEQQEYISRSAEPQGNSNKDVVEAVNKLSQQIAKQPNLSAQIVKAQKDLVEFVLTENKENMKKISREYSRAKP